MLVTLSFIVMTGCAPTAPKIEYPGVTSPGAIELFNKAETLEQRETIIQSLERNRRGSFDWGTFWRGLSKQSFERLTPEQRERVLDLAKEDCSERGFSEFSVLVLRLGIGPECRID